NMVDPELGQCQSLLRSLNLEDLHQHPAEPNKWRRNRPPRPGPRRADWRMSQPVHTTVSSPPRTEPVNKSRIGWIGAAEFTLARLAGRGSGEGPFAGCTRSPLGTHRCPPRGIRADAQIPTSPRKRGEVAGARPVLSHARKAGSRGSASTDRRGSLSRARWQFRQVRPGMSCRRSVLFGVALSRRGRLLCRSGTRDGATGSRCPASEPSALARGGMAFGLVAPRPALLAAAALLVDGRPGPPFCFFLGNAPRFVALGNMIGLALLLVGVFGFISTRHNDTPLHY